MSVREDGLPSISDADQKLICGMCGHIWGEHAFVFGECPNGRTKFYWAGSVSIGREPESRECPCGIYRGDCEYHK